MSEMSISGWVSNIERYTLHDGPGIRTTVFLKGCPLRCLWCSNPETQVDHPQLIYLEDKCNGCGICVGFCPGLAIFILDDTYSDTESLITIPWEFCLLPAEGSQVWGLNREGQKVAMVTVKKVRKSAKKNGAHLLTLIVPKDLAYDIRSISHKE